MFPNTVGLVDILSIHSFHTEAVTLLVKSGTDAN